jgi:hypothetical protein
VNSVLEQYLRAYVNYQQDDWDDWTPIAEFCFNNAVSESTQVSPFLANYGQHPRLGIEPKEDLPMPRLSSHARIEVQEANEFTERMESLTKHLRNEIRWAQEIYEEKANRSRNPAPAYKEGDRV